MHSYTAAFSKTSMQKIYFQPYHEVVQVQIQIYYKYALIPPSAHSTNTLLLNRKTSLGHFLKPKNCRCGLHVSDICDGDDDKDDEDDDDSGDDDNNSGSDGGSSRRNTTTTSTTCTLHLPTLQAHAVCKYLHYAFPHINIYIYIYMYLFSHVYIYTFCSQGGPWPKACKTPSRTGKYPM